MDTAELVGVVQHADGVWHVTTAVPLPGQAAGGQRDAIDMARQYLAEQAGTAIDPDAPTLNIRTDNAGVHFFGDNGRHLLSIDTRRGSWLPDGITLMAAFTG